MRRPLARSLILGRPGLFYGPAVRDYLDRVRAVDGDGLSRGVTNAINTYIAGAISAQMLGTSGGIIFQAASTIKAHCILAGANTLSGCLVPVVGPAPTNVNFVAGDYSRKLGLGDPANATKHLNTNRNNATDPQNNNHNSVSVSTAHSGAAVGQYIGSGASADGRNNLAHNPTAAPAESFARSRSSAATAIAVGPGTGFLGHARNNSSNFTFRAYGASAVTSAASTTPENATIDIFRRGTINYCNGKVQAYTIGEWVDLAVLQYLQDQLFATFAAFIP